MSKHDIDLNRFVHAQEHIYASALAEIRAGNKHSHWIWFVFPQLRGLGVSATSERYGLTGLGEARAYLAHPVLGPRLCEAASAMLAHRAKGPRAVLGDLDAMKLRSCLTLFAKAAPGEPVFNEALDALFGGEQDARTLTLLKAQGEC